MDVSIQCIYTVNYSDIIFALYKYSMIQYLQIYTILTAEW